MRPGSSRQPALGTGHRAGGTEQLGTGHPAWAESILTVPFLILFQPPLGPEKRVVLISAMLHTTYKHTPVGEYVVIGRREACTVYVFCLTISTKVCCIIAASSYTLARSSSSFTRCRRPLTQNMLHSLLGPFVISEPVGFARRCRRRLR